MACAFPEDAPNLDAKATDISYEDNSGPVIKGSFSGEQIDFDPEPEERFKVPKKKSPQKIVRVPGAQLRWILLHLDSPQYMKQFIKKHIETLCWAQEMTNNFLDLLKIFAPPDTKFREDMESETLMNILKDVLQHYQKRVAMLDVTVDKVELLEGTAIKLKIEDSSRKVGDLLESYETKMNAAEDNLMMLDDIIKQEREEKRIIIDHLATKVDQLYNALFCLEGRTSDQPTTTQEEFFKELKEHLEQDIRLNSTLLNSSALKEELAEEKRKKHILFREICTLKEDRILEEEQKMREIAELARDFQLEDGIKKEIVGRIKTLTADPDEVYKAVEDWMETIRSSIANKEGEIERLKKTLKDKEDEITDLRELNIKTNEQKHQYENIVLDLISECNNLLEEFNTKQQQLIDLDNGIDELDSKIRSRALSQTRYYDARSTLDSMRQSHSSSPTRYYHARSVLEGSPETTVGFGERSRSRSMSPHSPGYTNTTPKSAMYSPELKDLSGFGASYNSTQKLFQIPDEVDASGSYSLSLDESPEKLRHGSPYRGGTYFDDSNPTSIHSTPRSASPQYSVTPPSPFHMSSPLMQSYGESGVIVESPGTERIPGPKSKFAPRTSTFDTTTPRKVSNSFDIGKSFNLRTTCETSTPYHQVTRVESFIPESEYTGRVIEHPLIIMHSGEITPTQYKTPFISQSRFGYTDPSARILNMPPDLELFKQVTPSQQEQGISPDVVTYGTPPAVTPTTTCRHGLFTPKGIFRKKHFNVRRIFVSDYFDSPEYSGSHQYPPEDFRSPARISTFSPIYSDKSLSWEQQYNHPYDQHIMNKTFQTSPAMDRTFDATTSRAVNRTFGVSPPCAMNRTYDRSPASAMDRTFIASSPCAMDRTFDRSPISARNRTFDASPACAKDRTFYRPPASAMDRTFVASSPYAMDRTFDKSPISARNRTFDASPPFSMNRKFDIPPASAMDRTFVAPSPYAMDRTFDRSPISARNRTFDASPACAINRTFDRSPPSAIDRTFVTLSPCATNKTFDTYPALAMDRTFDASSPSLINRTFVPTSPYDLNKTDASPSYAMNRTFKKSLSSPLGRTFQQSPSLAFPPYAINRTFDRTPMSSKDKTFDASSSQTTNRTFNTSSPHALNTTFGASPSYAMNKSFNKSLSSPIGRTFQQRQTVVSSPYDMNRTFDAPLPQPMNRTFDSSSPHNLKPTFGVSPSSTINRTFNKSLSSPIGRTFHQSP